MGRAQRHRWRRRPPTFRKRTCAPPPVMVAAIYDWTGFYIGANGGYGTSRNCWGFVPVAVAVIPDGCHNQSEGHPGRPNRLSLAGRSSCVRFGSAGDWASLRSSHVSLVNPLLTDSSKVTGLGPFTGQIGYAWNAAPLYVPLYVKGGAAATSDSLLQATHDWRRRRTLRHQPVGRYPWCRV